MHGEGTAGKGMILIVKPNATEVNSTYQFDVFIYKEIGDNHRNATTYSSLTVTNIQIPEVGILTESKAYYIPQDTIRFQGTVEGMGPEDVRKYKFEWSCYIFGPNPEYDRDMADLYESGKREGTYDVPINTFVLADESNIDFNDPESFRTPLKRSTS
jgi:hypothetical protein